MLVFREGNGSIEVIQSYGNYKGWHASIKGQREVLPAYTCGLQKKTDALEVSKDVSSSCFSFSRWWSQISYIFTPTWRNDPIWLIFFPMGWNHQEGCPYQLWFVDWWKPGAFWADLLLLCSPPGSPRMVDLFQKLRITKAVFEGNDLNFFTLKIFSTFQLQLSGKGDFLPIVTTLWLVLVAMCVRHGVGVWLVLGSDHWELLNPIGSQGHHFSPEPWLFRFDIGDDKLPNYMGIIS